MIARKTSALWVLENPVLANGESGAESDTARLKIWNGSSAWNDLPYYASGIGSFGDASSVERIVPTGYLVNGRLNVSASSGALTISVKTLALDDPSADDPVHVRVGGYVHRLTAPLSLVLPPGTDYMNAGGSMFAGKEVDYFVYVGHRAGDLGAFLAIARVPHYVRVSDSPSGATDARRLTVSSGAAPASSDGVENVGRFSAILSSGKAWSLPADPRIIDRPTHTSRILDYVPNLNLGSAALSGYDVAQYQVVDGLVKVDFFANNRNLSGTAGTVDVSLPFQVNAYTGTVSAIGYATGLSNVFALAQIRNDRVSFNKGGTFANFDATETNVYLRFNEILAIA